MKEGKRTRSQLEKEIRSLRKQIKELKARVIESERYQGTIERLKLREKELYLQSCILSSTLRRLDLDATIELVLEELLRAFNVNFIGFYLYDQGHFILRQSKGLSSNLRSHLLSFPAVTAPDWIITSKVFHDKLEEVGSIPGFMKSEGIQTLASFQLALPAEKGENNDRVLGSFFLASRRYESLDGEDIRLLQNIADQFSLAVDHSLTYLNAHRRLKRLRVLHKIDRAIIQRLRLKDVLYVVLEQIPCELGADAAAISLLDGENGRPKIFVMRLPNGTFVEEEAFVVAESLLHWLVERKETVIIYELAEDPRLQMYWDKIRGHKLSSYLGVPLVVHETAIGILHILTKEPRIFEEEDVSFFKTMGGQVAIAIENVRLFESTQNYALKLEEKVKELEKLTEELKSSQASLTEAQRIARLGSWHWDIVNNELYWSQEVLEIFDLKPDEFEGTYEAFLSRVHPEDRDYVKKSVDEAFKEGKPYSIEHKILLDDGSIRVIHERAEVVCDELGRPVKMIGTAQDISRYKEMEQIIAQQSKMASLGHFAAGIAHEIRNPLAGINICLDAIKETIQDPEAHDETLNLIDQAKNATEKIDAVVKRIMAFATSGEPELKLVDINLAIEEALGISLPKLRRSGIVVHKALSKRLPKILADTQLIEQVVLNLLSNAVEAFETADQDREIAISSSTENEYVVIRIDDSGPGIPPDLRDNIFEPFYTTKPEGAGIGLSLCERIIIGHGGSIDVRDSYLGGAQFIIRIPIKKRI